MTDMSISVIVPVYNERQLIGQSLNAIEAFVAQHFSKYEILVVESGSTDGSDRLCDEIASVSRRISVIHEGQRKGYGSALRAGIGTARHDLIWPLTLDMPFPLHSLLLALPLLDSYDCVLSFRSDDPRRRVRRLQSLAYNSLIRLTLRLRVRHINSAFKLFKRSVFHDCPLRSNGWFIDAEIVYRLQQSGVRLIEIGVPLVDRTAGASSIGVATWLDVLRELWLFLRDKGRSSKCS